VTVAQRNARLTAAARTQPTDREQVFESIFAEHYARVYGVLFRLVGDRAEAEDLALEAFWRLWERAAHWPENMGGWLYRVATNLGYNALRAGKRRAVYETDALLPEAPPNPELAAETAAERQRVRQVLEHLPARDAQLLILRHSGLAYKEIAAALQIAPASVGTLLARAEKEFERLWENDHDPSA